MDNNSNNTPQGFDRYASLYDSWFMENPNVLQSEVALVCEVLRQAGPGRVLSVGCGSGLFESILASQHGISITDGIEPSTPMADIARHRGMIVTECTAEQADYGNGIYDTIMFNGSPGYITDLHATLHRVHAALALGGHVILIDVPKESGYGVMYNLAKALGTWDHPLLEGVNPPNPYPIGLVSVANWRTTAEKIDILRDCGFADISTMQTLTTHPLYSDSVAEQPQPGHDKGDYVAVIARKP